MTWDKPLPPDMIALLATQFDDLYRIFGFRRTSVDQFGRSRPRGVRGYRNACVGINSKGLDR